MDSITRNIDPKVLNDFLNSPLTLDRIKQLESSKIIDVVDYDVDSSANMGNEDVENMKNETDLKDLTCDNQHLSDNEIYFKIVRKRKNRGFYSPENLVKFLYDTSMDQIQNSQSQQEDSIRLLIVRVLERLFQFPGVLLSFFSDPMIIDLLPSAAAALSKISSQSESSIRLRVLISSQLYQLTKNGSEGIDVLMNNGMYSILSSYCADEELSVSSPACKAILESLQYLKAQDAFLTDEFYERMMSRVGKISEEIDLRIFDLVITAAKKSDRIFNYFERKGTFDKVMNLYFQDDLLVKINAIQLIEALGSFPAGIEYMSKKEIPLKLLEDLSDESLVAAECTIRVCLINILSNILEREPSMCADIFQKSHGIFVSTLHEFIEGDGSPDEAKEMKICLIGSIGSVCTSPQGMKAVEEFLPLALDNMIDVLGEEVEMSNLTFDAFAHMLEKIDKTTPFFETFLQKKLIPTALNVFVSRPFLESRIHAYPLLQGLAKFNFFGQLFFANEKARKILVTYNSEGDAEAYRCKYDFAKSIKKEQFKIAKELMGSDYCRRLEEYIEGGAFFIPKGASKLATESL